MKPVAFQSCHWHTRAGHGVASITRLSKHRVRTLATLSPGDSDRHGQLEKIGTVTVTVQCVHDYMVVVTIKL